MRRKVFASVVAASVVAVAMGCDAVPDVTFGTATTDGGPGGGNTDGPPGVTDGMVPSDGSSMDGTVTTGPCGEGGAEICDDGIDNDCNGKTDCADPACNAGYACVDPLPADWTMVAYTEAVALPNCPTGFGTMSDIVSIKGTGAASCMCPCTPMGGTACSAGTYTIAVSTAADCSGGNPPTESVPTGQTACTALTTAIDVPANANAKITAPVGPTACSTTPASTIPPVNNARSCAGPMKVGLGCANGQVCAPVVPGGTVSTGYGICGTKAGVNACPAKYSVARRSGTSDTDSRSCSTCACNLTPCSGSVTLSTQANCMNGHTDTVVANSTCAPLPGAPYPGMGGAAYYKSSAAGGGCTVGTGSTPQGTLTFTGETTICCKN